GQVERVGPARRGEDAEQQLAEPDRAAEDDLGPLGEPVRPPAQPPRRPGGDEARLLGPVDQVAIARQPADGAGFPVADGVVQVQGGGPAGDFELVTDKYTLTG